MGGPPRSGGGPVHLHTMHIPKATTAPHTLVCAFAVQVQVFLVLLQTVTGLAVLYLPVAGTVLG